MNQQNLVNFVENLDLGMTHMPTLRASGLLKAATDDNKESASVTDGSAVSFVSGVKGQVRDDILNSLLVAQLAANKVADRFIETIEWYKKYTEVLGKLGWVIQDFNFQHQGSSSVKLSVNNVICNILSTFVSSEGISIIDKMLEALQNTASDSALTFNMNSSYKNNSNFQLGHVNQDKDGIVSMSAAAVEIHTSTHSSGWWLWKVDTSSADVTAAAQTMTFNTDLYDQIRDIVRKKLGITSEEYIKDLDI